MMVGPSLLRKVKAGEAKHGGLPEAAEGGQVNAGRGVAHVVGQINFTRLPEIALGQRDYPQFAQTAARGWPD